jgi:pimeloyl-ACP methyl ester carboxylesterase
VSFTESGDPAGSPVLYIPGFGHSRLAVHPGAQLALSAGVRVIAVDPPGIGGSSPDSGYSLSSWASGLRPFLDHLRIEELAVLGWSWGGPYALAAAQALPDRVTRVGLVSALAGWLTGPGAVRDVAAEFRTFAVWCRWFTPGVRAFLATEARAVCTDYDRTVAREARNLGPADQRVLANPELARTLRASRVAAWHQGVEGMFDHSRAVTLPWGFDPSEVSQPVHVWQGGDDREILPSMVERIMERLPDCRVQRYPGEGHLLLFDHWTDILGALRQQPDR